MEQLNGQDNERIELNFVRRPKHIGKYRDPNTIKRFSSRNNEELEALYDHFYTLTNTQDLEQHRNEFKAQNRLEISARLYMRHLNIFKANMRRWGEWFN
jgi:hypothetical protein